MVCKHCATPRSICRVLAQNGDSLRGESLETNCKDTTEEWSCEGFVVLCQKLGHGGFFCGLHDAGCCACDVLDPCVAFFFITVPCGSDHKNSSHVWNLKDEGLELEVDWQLICREEIFIVVGVGG